ncbi:hypothetical protein [Natronomonas sp. LN261]|uniref:hypothetical protein n=1 Tax=Natronomonas sp. LN261 TaxID=2750669 RepID=UPI0015EF798B|nr:hypothetical protein [Natronomonas sp. LN261]
MFETVWPRLRTIGRLGIFVGALAVVVMMVAQILDVLFVASIDVRFIQGELLVIFAALGVMLLATKV